MRIFKLCIIFILVIPFLSCKKEIGFTQDHLDFSSDTVLFDTVFTTVGSTTKRLKIYNYNNQPINVEAIQLMGGNNSPFRINVDGIPVDYLENIEIPANDSIFIFIEVTLQVNNNNNPLIISDSIRFRTNGLDQYVNLDVWGQDAYFHVNELVEGIWSNDKPHVIYGVAAVGYPGLDSNKTLTIFGGTEVYCHKGAQLLVYKSSIDIQGTYGNEVIFQGDRLESFYDDVSGQWGGIRMIEANYSTIDYAIIKNGSVGLQVDSTQSAQTLLLTNTIIDNNDFFGLNVNAGANVSVENCLFGKAGIISTYLFAGGEYHFNNCNFVNYWAGSRSGPSIAIVNWWEYEGVTYCRDIINSEFNNCIAFGTIDDEFIVDTLDCGGTTVDFQVRYSVLKNSNPYTYSNYSSIKWNENPAFVDAQESDFHLQAGSPSIGAGNIVYSTISDIEGNPWGATIESGCYNY